MQQFECSEKASKITPIERGAPGLNARIVAVVWLAKLLERQRGQESEKPRPEPGLFQLVSPSGDLCHSDEVPP